MGWLEIEPRGKTNTTRLYEVESVRISRTVVPPIPTDYRIVIVKEVLHVDLIRRYNILSENTHLSPIADHRIDIAGRFAPESRPIAAGIVFPVQGVSSLISVASSNGETPQGTLVERVVRKEVELGWANTERSAGHKTIIPIIGDSFELFSSCAARPRAKTRQDR